MYVVIATLLTQGAHGAQLSSAHARALNSYVPTEAHNVIFTLGAQEGLQWTPAWSAQCCPAPQGNLSYWLCWLQIYAQVESVTVCEGIEEARGSVVDTKTWLSTLPSPF
eukprot:1146721-Pelagomonas_calceolata.AAC.4